MLLPAPYQYTRIKQQAGTRFEAFDFSAHNATRFGGLENDLANCYTNALWQVLYFIPQLRWVLLQTLALAAVSSLQTLPDGVLTAYLAAHLTIIAPDGQCFVL